MVYVVMVSNIINIFKLQLIDFVAVGIVSQYRRNVRLGIELQWKLERLEAGATAKTVNCTWTQACI